MTYAFARGLYKPSPEDNVIAANLKLGMAITHAEIDLAEKIGNKKTLISLIGALFTPSNDNGNLELYQENMKEAEKLTNSMISCLLPYIEQKEDKIEEVELLKKYKEAFNLSE